MRQVNFWQPELFRLAGREVVSAVGGSNMALPEGCLQYQGAWFLEQVRSTVILRSTTGCTGLGSARYSCTTSMSPIWYSSLDVMRWTLHTGSYFLSAMLE